MQSIRNHNPEYIKVIDALGRVEHRPWISVYERMRDAAGIKSPGYVIHEAAVWSELRDRWFFIPRRSSVQA